MENKTFDFRFEVKAEDVKTDGTFKGYASTFGGDPDSYSDIIEAGAFTETLKKNGYGGNGIKMLWQHDTTQPIGVWTALREDKKGLYVEGKLAVKTEQGNNAYELLSMGALNTMSIGFNTKKSSYDEELDIRTLIEVDLWEISLVTFPANVSATITAVKAAVEDIELSLDNPRKLESLLRDANGLSQKAAKLIVSLCKEGLKKRDASTKNLESVRDALKKLNADLKIS